MSEKNRGHSIAIDQFIHRWKYSGASEWANYQLNLLRKTEQDQ
ncbi:hypothetical protein [Nibribacter ruber]|nr:hypothetical protein [Nibribacter ruber]